MSLWAPNATFTIGPGQTLRGKDQIRRFWLESDSFQSDNAWVSETPAYKIRITVNGDRGTLYFECHYIDPKTAKVVAEAGVTHTLQKVKGQWLITDSAGSTATLSP